MYPYNTAERPPAPFVAVTVVNPESLQTEIIVGKLDTGAARTIIPVRVARTLGLLIAGWRNLRAFDGQLVEVFMYRVNLELAGAMLEKVEVGAVERSNILLGRDILNQFDITLRGKQQVFEMMAA